MIIQRYAIWLHPLHHNVNGSHCRLIFRALFPACLLMKVLYGQPSVFSKYVGDCKWCYLTSIVTGSSCQVFEILIQSYMNILVQRIILDFFVTLLIKHYGKGRNIIFWSVLVLGQTIIWYNIFDMKMIFWTRRRWILDIAVHERI